MTRVRRGVTLPVFTDDRARLERSVKRARDAGLDSVWVFDHLWPLSGGKDRPILESWSTLAWLAARTEGLRIGTLVTRSSLRRPALLGKMAATLGMIAPGRVIVGLGSGDAMSRAENEGFGIPYYAGAERHAQLLSTLAAVHAYLTEPEVTLHDGFAAIDRLPSSPRSHPPPAIWAAGRSRAILETAGRLCDGWNGWGGTPEQFAADAAVVRAAARGRPVETTWAGLAVLADSAADARARLGGRKASEYVVGGPDEVGAHLRSLAAAGAEHLIVTFPDGEGAGNFERLGGLDLDP